MQSGEYMALKLIREHSTCVFQQQKKKKRRKNEREIYVSDLISNMNELNVCNGVECHAYDRQSVLLKTRIRLKTSFNRRLH